MRIGGHGGRWRALAAALALLATVVLVAACGGDDEDQSQAAAGGGDKKGVKVGVALKGVGNQFFVFVADGVKQGAEEKGAEATIQSAPLLPGGEADPQAQVRIIEDMLTKGVDALVVAPVSADQVKPVLDRAVSQKVPVILVDTPIPGWGKETAFVGTNNYKSGKAMGQYIVDHLKGKGEMGMLDGTPGATAETDRMKGVSDAVAGSDMKIVAHGKGEADEAKSQATVEDFLLDHPNMDAVVGAWTRPALGALRAVSLSKHRPMIVGGHDAEPDEIAALQPDKDPDIPKGVSYVTVAQQPIAMGKQALEAAVAAANGDKVEKVIETGYDIVDADNVAEYKQK